MRTPLARSTRIASALLLAAACSAQRANAEPPAPISYTVTLTSPQQHVADVEATIPTGGRDAIELMMAAWSPGFYRVEHYATRIDAIAAHGLDGAALPMTRATNGRWRVDTRGRPSIVVSYRLACAEHSVTTNWVGDDYAVLNGAATFITLAEDRPRPHDVQLELPAGWSRSLTALPDAADGRPNHYRAVDFDTVVDSPIIAGNPAVRQFDVAGSIHDVAAVGEMGSFDLARAGADLKKVVEAQRRLWGGLPFKRYDFLLVFRPGGGGLEHKNSVLATTRATATDTADAYRGWLNFISHEYGHAFNVKRLRPIELGPFDYEREPHTSSLWISEGFTSYFGELAVARAGLSTPADVLASLSAKIEQLQKSPGRLKQTLEQASTDVWTSEGVSGVNTNANTTVSYYLKGQIVGFLLDAEVRRATRGAKSLDDVMRLAYRRYSGARGFAPEQFRRTASEVAGIDLGEWLRRAVASTEELDYAPALDWYGLEFTPGTWTIAVRDDATGRQRARLRALFDPA